MFNRYFHYDAISQQSHLQECSPVCPNVPQECFIFLSTISGLNELQNWVTGIVTFAAFEKKKTPLFNMAALQR